MDINTLRDGGGSGGGVDDNNTTATEGGIVAAGAAGLSHSAAAYAYHQCYCPQCHQHFRTAEALASHRLSLRHQRRSGRLAGERLAFNKNKRDADITAEDVLALLRATQARLNEEEGREVIRDWSAVRYVPPTPPPPQKGETAATETATTTATTTATVATVAATDSKEKENGAGDERKETEASI